MLSFLNIKDGYIYSRYESNSSSKISNQHLILPEIIVENIDEKAEKVLRPLFDMLWNACGYSACKSYNEQGQWKPKTEYY
ncbi:MAG: hypothetical protein IPM57_10460 [Oligoflexia bacterium]|nr:hypothetical protein [Oligoflexia bacterium]